MRRRFLTAVALALSAFVLSFAGDGPFGSITVAKANAASMDETCAECHSTLAPAFSKTYHGRAWSGMNSDSSCQSCHGSVDNHLNNPDTETILSFSKNSGNSSEALNKKCLNCHTTSSMLSFWEVGSHSRNDVSCTSCHAIHSEQSSVNQVTVCLTCHRSEKSQVSKRSHHPIEEGKVQCSDCHNPHGTQSSHSMIKAENVNQLCYQCHADKRGPFIYEHPPVEENCVSCHTPHGSRHDKLLTEKVPNLCQDCHDWSRHPGTPYDGKNGFTGSNPSNRFFGRSCLNCHGAIHGSTSFENHALTR